MCTRIFVHSYFFSFFFFSFLCVYISYGGAQSFLNKIEKELFSLFVHAGLVG